MKEIFSKENRGDLLVTLFLILCLVISTNVFKSFMPSSIVMVVIALFVALFSLYAMLVWKENPRDEREAQLLLTSDRLGFLAGAIVLSVSLVITSLKHESTNILALSLGVMILAKIIGKHLKM